MKFKAVLFGAVSMLGLAAVSAAEGMGTGTINEVKTTEEKLNITHGPIPGVMDTGMTMDFVVMDPAMIDAVKKGDKVKFTVEEQDGGRFVITDLEVIAAGNVAVQEP